MLITWIKGDMNQLSPNFRANELACRCKYPECQTQWIDEASLLFLETARLFLDRQFPINDAYRCKRHNADRQVGGTPGSQHPKGKAFDVALVLSDDDWQKLDQFVGDRGGLGRYDWGFHIDYRGSRARWDFRSHVVSAQKEA